MSNSRPPEQNPAANANIANAANAANAANNANNVNNLAGRAQQAQNFAANHPQVVNQTAQVIKILIKWPGSDETLQLIKSAREVIYYKIDADNQTRMFANLLEVTDNNELCKPYTDNHIEIEGMPWEGGVWGTHLQKAASFLSYYLKNRSVFSDWRAHHDHRAYICFDAIKSLNMLASKELDENLIKAIENLCYGYQALIGKIKIVSLSHFAFSAPHLKPTMIEVIEQLQKAVKIAKYEDIHQSSAKDLSGIYRANETIHFDLVPNTLMRFLSNELISLPLDYDDFYSNWDGNNDTLLQAIIYLYFTKIAKLKSSNAVSINNENSPTVALLISAIEKTLQRKNINSDTPEYCLAIIDEISKITMERSITNTYAYYRYIDDNANKQKLEIKSGISPELRSRETLLLIQRVLIDAMVTGNSYSAQKYFHEYSKDFGDIEFYKIAVQTKLNEMLDKSLEKLEDLSYSLLNLSDHAQSISYAKYSNDSAPENQQRNLNHGILILDSQPIYISYISGVNDKLIAKIETWNGEERVLTQSEMINKYKVSCEQLDRSISLAQDKIHALETNQDASINSPDDIEELEEPGADANINAEAAPEPSPAPEEKIPDMVGLFSEVLSECSDSQTCIQTLLINLDTLDRLDKSLADRQHKVEKFKSDSEYSKIAEGELITTFKKRSDLIQKRIGLFKCIEAKQEFHPANNLDIREAIKKRVKSIKKSLHDDKTPLELSPHDEHKRRYKESVYEEKAYFNTKFGI